MLLLILLVAFGLRFWDAGLLPNGLHWDEMDTGYQALSLYKTGRDYFGSPLPLFPHSFADWRTPVFVYSAVPFVAKLGLSPASVRLPALTWSLTALVSLYLLSYRLFKSRLAALISTACLSLSVWHLIYSRKSVETGSLMALSLVSVTLFLRGLRRPRYLVLSGLFFTLSVAAYSPGKLFIPLLVLSLIVIYRRQLFATPKKYLAAAFVVLTLTSLPVYWDTFFGASGSRFHDLSIFTDPTTASQIDYQRLDFDVSSGRPKEVGMSPGLVTRLVHNKPVYWLGRLTANYLTTFSTDFLFIKGDPEPRHSPGKDVVGMLPPFASVALLLGLFYIFKKTQPTTYHLQLVLAWLILAPLPSALTRDGGNHAARLLILLPALILTITAGFMYLRQKSRVLLFVSCFLYLVSSSWDVTYFFTHYRFESAKPYQWGFSENVRRTQDASPAYDRVILDFHADSPLMAYLFTTSLDPGLFQALHPLPDIQLTDQISAKVFGNIYLLNPGTRRWTEITLPGRNLVISAADQPLLDTLSPKLQTITYPDSTPAYYTFEKP